MSSEPNNSVKTKKQILIVEDESLMSMLLGDTVEELGYDLAGICSVLEDAQDVLETQPIDAAILDVNIRGKDSFHLADLLIEKQIPFIFSTGYEPYTFPEKYWDYPALQKPYALPELKEHLSFILQGKLQPDQNKINSLGNIQNKTSYLKVGSSLPKH